MYMKLELKVQKDGVNTLKEEILSHSNSKLKKIDNTFAWHAFFFNVTDSDHAKAKINIRILAVKLV